MDVFEQARAIVARMMATSEHLFAAADACQRAADEMAVIVGAVEGLSPVEVSPPCDVEPQDAPHPTFTDMTHAVFHCGEPVYSGTKDECQCFADNHFPSGGYGIGPVQD